MASTLGPKGRLEESASIAAHTVHCLKRGWKETFQNIYHTTRKKSQHSYPSVPSVGRPWAGGLCCLKSRCPTLGAQWSVKFSQC